MARLGLRIMPKRSESRLIQAGMMGDFQQWAKSIFDRPADGEAEVLADAEALAFMTRVFAQCGTILKPYSDDQIAHGISFLTDPRLSACANIAISRDIPLDQRAAFLDSIAILYRDCFEPRCQPHTELAATCLTLWETNTLAHQIAAMGKKKKSNGDYGQRSIAIQNTFESIMKLSNPVCLESGLRGLRQAQPHAPLIIDKITDAFFAQHSTHLSSWMIPYLPTPHATGAAS